MDVNILTARGFGLLDVKARGTNNYNFIVKDWKKMLKIEKCNM
jgi:hypothetical protein